MGKLNKAYTLTELLVATGLTSLVLLALGLALFSSTEDRILEQMKTDLKSQALVASRQIQQDLQSAIRPSGSGSSDERGIWRINADGTAALARADPSDNDNLAMYVYEYPELSTPILGISATGASNAIGPDGEVMYEYSVHIPRGELVVPSSVDRTQPGVIRAYNAQNYMQAARSTYEIFVISNSRATHIVMQDILNKPAVESTVGTQDSYLLTLYFFSSDFDIDTDLFNSDEDAPSLGTAARVDYRLDTSPILYSRLNRVYSRSRAIPDLSSAETILESVKASQVDYYFGNRRAPWDGKDLLDAAGVIPDVGLSHLSEAGISELSWRDITHLQGWFQIVSTDELPGGIESINSPNFNADSDHLTFKAYWSSLPTAFASSLQDVSDSGTTACPIEDPTTRCNEDCENIFDSPNRTDPKWEGYGRHIDSDDPSDHCICGQDPTTKEYLDPSTTAGRAAVSSWTPGLSTAGKNRVNACVRDLRTCSGGGIKEKDPRLWVACTCMRDFDDWVDWDNYPSIPLSSPHSGGSLEGKMSTIFSKIEADTATTDELNNLKCDYWQTCESRARTLSGLNPAGFEKYCGCFTKKKDESGNDLSSNLNQLDWSKLCSPAACPDNYYDAGGGSFQHKIINEEFAGSTPTQGLDGDQAGFCECRNDYGTSTEGVSDFRKAAQAGDPSGPNSVSGSVQCESYSFTSAGGTPYSGDCCQADCSAVSGDRFGCCVSQTLSGRPLERWDGSNPMPADPAVADPSWIPTHSGYCVDRCPEAKTDIIQTRLSIFGVGDTEDLPSYCGRTGSGGGSPAQ